jgi:hypothetical protein
LNEEVQKPSTLFLQADVMGVGLVQDQRLPGDRVNPATGVDPVTLLRLVQRVPWNSPLSPIFRSSGASPKWIQCTALTSVASIRGVSC